MSVQEIRRRCLLNANGATEAAVDVELLSAIREFCNQSGIWTEREYLDTIEGQQTYELDPPAGTEIVMVDSVIYRNRVVRPNSDHGRRRGVFERGYRTEGDDKVIVLNEQVKGAEEGGLIVDYWLRPSDLDSAPRLVTEDYDEGIFTGTMGRLMRQVNRPYTNPTMGVRYLAEFRKFMAQARRAKLSSRSYSDAPAPMPLTTRSRSLRRGSI